MAFKNWRQSLGKSVNVSVNLLSLQPVTCPLWGLSWEHGPLYLRETNLPHHLKHPVPILAASESSPFFKGIAGQTYHIAETEALVVEDSLIILK